MAEPTDIDHANYAVRKAIAERQAAEYSRVQAFALSLFGPGYEPAGRHFLVTHEEEDRVRREGGKLTPVATVYTVRKGPEKRHFTVTDGVAKEVSGYEEAFGPLLLEPDPVRGFMHKGQFVHVHKHSLCWAPFELYEPRTAQELADARRRREERAEAKWQAAVEADATGSLFPEYIREQAEEARKKGRGR